MHSKSVNPRLLYSVHSMARKCFVTHNNIMTTLSKHVTTTGHVLKHDHNGQRWCLARARRS